MTEKTLIIINEPFEEMILGKNTTLSYIAAALDLGHEVYIHNLPKNGEIFPKNIQQNIEAIKLDSDDSLAKNLINEYKKRNEGLANLIEEALKIKDPSILQKFSNIKVSEILQSSFFKTPLILSSITNVIQRIEPMKAPFAPEGNANLLEVLQQIKKIFPQLSFNCPIYEFDGESRLLIDKDTPQIMNEILLIRSAELMATPTREFSLEEEASEHFAEMTQEYLRLYPNKIFGKVVLKPKDSAQSLGVFAVEFSDETIAFNLSSLKNSTLKSFKETQLYKIKSALNASELKEITEILCYAESLKTNEENFAEKCELRIADISSAQRRKVAKNLYEKVLIQPFLEGVKSGDIRANIVKNSDGIFELAGITYRRSNRYNNDKFTTCLTTGGSSPFPISILEKEEQISLASSLKLTLEMLNKLPLKERYQNSSELGADFLLLGDGKNIFLGEINHHCPALAPLSEIMNKIDNLSISYAKYDGGLGITKATIQNQINHRKN